MSFAFNGNVEVKRPYNIPQGRFIDGMWFRIRPRKLEYQTTAGRGGSMKINKEVLPTFMFLAPDTVLETANHSWNAYESVQSRLAGKIRSVAKLGEEVNALKNSFNLSNVSDVAKSLTSGSGEKVLKTIYNAIPGSTVANKIKIDTPLVYETSERREWVLLFNIIAEKNPKTDVVDVVQDIMKYSSPEVLQGDVDIDLPYVFNISTFPNSYINAPYTALTSVQPTWKGPYSNGYPTACEVTLTFKDLSPLFRKTIETGSVINVIVPKQTNTPKRSGNL